MDEKDWIEISSTILLAGTAFVAPYFIEKWKYTYHSPELKIKFKLNPPGCHKTLWDEHGEKTPVYYFRFLVENTGKTQADECEVLLEEIFKKNSAGEYVKERNFTPVNLKWSGVSGAKQKTIQPGRAIFCDLGRVHHPKHNYRSVYHNISESDQKLNKFAFELPDLYYSQWDCLLPGNYKVTVSIYSKNAKKITRKFDISWTGKWEDEESNMFNELVIR